MACQSRASLTQSPRGLLANIDRNARRACPPQQRSRIYRKHNVQAVKILLAAIFPTAWAGKPRCAGCACWSCAREKERI